MIEETKANRHDGIFDHRYPLPLLGDLMPSIQYRIGMVVGSTMLRLNVSRETLIL